MPTCEFSILLRDSKAEALLEEHVAQQARGETELKARPGRSCLCSSSSSCCCAAAAGAVGAVVACVPWVPLVPVVLLFLLL